MNKLQRAEYFLITKKNNFIFLISLIMYSFLASNIFIWTKKNNTYIKDVDMYNVIFFDSIVSSYTFIWGLFFIYSYFSELNNGFYSRLILNDFSRNDIFKLKSYRIFFLCILNIALAIIIYYISQFIQFDSIKYQLNVKTLFLFFQIILMSIYSLYLSYSICLYFNNMVLSIFLVYFLTKLDITLSYFSRINSNLYDFNYLPLSCIQRSTNENISYMSYLIFIIYIILLYSYSKRKQLKLNL